jgi:hypothetical protein
MATKLIPTVEINGEHVDYQHLNIEHIIAWCKANNEVKWLKETASKKVEYKVYPKVKGEDGKMRVDKTQEPKVEMRSISFIQIKIEFVEKFMPELKPEAKPKKASMYDLIAAL